MSESDFYIINRPQQPKREIGEYVRMHGFPVPLIDSNEEWHEALLDGTAMVRSEHPQDYDGLSGIFDSHRLEVYDPESRGHKDIIEQAIRDELLENDRVDPAYWLKQSVWARNLNHYYKSIVDLEIPKRFHIAKDDWEIGPLPTSASKWRYVTGLNITMFRDPHIDGRYFYATNRDTDDTYNSMKSSGSIDAGQYDMSLQLPTYHLDVPAQRVINLYEAVRTLPKFDKNHAPVIEMQLGDDNELYFLQYYKTRWQLDPKDAFDLPADGIRIDSARGVTDKQGADCRLYVRTDRLAETIVGQAVDLGFGKSESLKQTFASRMASIVLPRAGVTLRGTHGAQAMLYMPDVTIDLYGELEQQLNTVCKRTYGDYVGNIYVNAHITANGREAVVDSGFKPIYEPLP